MFIPITTARSDRLGSDNQTIAKRVAIWGSVVPPGPARLRGFTAAERECRRQRSVIVLHNTAEELAANGLVSCSSSTKKDAFAVSGTETRRLRSAPRTGADKVECELDLNHWLLWVSRLYKIQQQSTKPSTTMWSYNKI